MNEIKHLEKLWADTPEPSRQWFARTRNRLHDEASYGGNTGASRSPLRPRRATRLAAAGGLTAAVVGGVFAIQTVDLGSGPAAAASADELLRRAAATAAAEPSHGSGEFAYVHTKRTSRFGGGRSTTVEQQWLSVDDSEPGRVRSKTSGEGTLVPERVEEDQARVEDGESAVVDSQPGQWQRRTIPEGSQSESLLPGPTYAYLRTVSTEPAKLAKMLRSELRGIDNSVGPLGGIGLIVSDQVVPPETAAGLFRAAQRFDGVTVDEQFTLAATGERGIAVTRTSHGTRTALVFDSESYDYLGSQRIRDGKVLASTAVMAEGLVDNIGQRP